MGGFHHLMGYDEGVYFGAANGFVSGLVPYRDFVLVHPPGILLLLSPFAALGHLTTDTTGWTAARLAVMCIGALNAVLVYTIARRVSLVAGIAAGGLYAVWTPAVWVERTTMLEAFVLVGILVALWAIRSPQEITARLLLGGAFLGLATSVKLWGAVPLLVIVAWLLLSRAWKAAGWVCLAAAAVLLAVVGPFFAMAPRRMFDLIILGQVSRGHGGGGRLDRLTRMLNADIHQVVAHPRIQVAVVLLAGILLAGAIAVMWRRLPVTRLWSALLIVQVLVLLATPVYFRGYSSFIAPALMLVTGSAIGLAWARCRSAPPVPRAIGIGALAALLVVAATGSILRSDVKEPLDHAGIAAASPYVRSAQCVGSDSAGILILSDVLTRNLQRNCPSVFDVDGTIYSINSGANPGDLSSTKRRLASPEYQKLLDDYFTANDVVLIHRAKADGLSAQTRAHLRARPLLVKARGLRVYGPTPASRGGRPRATGLASDPPVRNCAPAEPDDLACRRPNPHGVRSRLYTRTRLAA